MQAPVERQAPEGWEERDNLKSISALAPWFGSNRLLAENVGRALDGCDWVGVPFAGGMSELAHIKARTLAVNDLHLHVMNLASIVADPIYGPKLYRRLRRVPFHPWPLEAAQRSCATYDPPNPMGGDMEARLNFAADYFICAWMARNGKAGTHDEFQAGPAMRWESGGGDSAVRFRNAVLGLRAWRTILARATFTTLDVFEFLGKCKDRKGHGLYLDPPFPGPGDAYKHKFGPAKHVQLRAALSGYRETRIVCRFYENGLIEELYPEKTWTWHRLTGRKQTNDAAPEVLIVRN